MTAYVAGPMSGYPEHNFPAFDRATRWLRGTDAFERVISPAELTRADAAAHGHEVGDRSWEFCMRQDLAAIVVDCDAIVLLAGWQNSRGARLERLVAEQLGLKLFRFVEGWGDEGPHLSEIAADGTELGELTQVDAAKPFEVTQAFVAAAFPEPPRETILQEADRLVSVSRQEAYGSPMKNWDAIARYWQAHLDNRKATGPLTAEDAAVMMVLMKCARLETGQPDHRDSQVDIAGYAKVYHLIREERRATAEP